MKTFQRESSHAIGPCSLIVLRNLNFIGETLYPETFSDTMVTEVETRATS